MRTYRGLWVLLFAASLAGCGSGDTVWVKGVLKKGGEVYKPAEGRKVALYFHPMKSDAGNNPTEIEMANYDSRDGSFTVPGREGIGIAPGKYRIAVVETLRREEFDKVKKSTPKKRKRRDDYEKPVDKETNLLEEQFGEHTSPFVHELTTSTTLTLDMAKPTQ